LLLEILQYFQSSEVGGDIAMVLEASCFGEPDLRGGPRVDAMLEECGRIVMVNLPITSLEPPVDGRRERIDPTNPSSSNTALPLLLLLLLLLLIAIISRAFLLGRAGEF
jgi:hypothetical protein